MSDEQRLIRVVVADDHPMARRGTQAILEQSPGVAVIATASDGAETLRLVAERRPDLLVLDVRLPDISGIQVARKVRTGFPEVKILIVTGYDDVGYARALLEIGVDGYLKKTASAEEIVAAVNAIESGKRVFEARAIAETFELRIEPLTPHEMEVLRLLAEGRRNAEIADILGRSAKTVEYHVTHILGKLGARSRAEAIIKAQRAGIAS